MKIKVDDITAAIEFEFDQYGESVREDVARAVSQVSSDLVKALRQTSPKRTGRYAKGWTRKMSKPREQPAAIVHNKDRYFLAHLLERGHAKPGGGTVPAQPHIEKAADAASKELEYEIFENLNPR